MEQEMGSTMTTTKKTNTIKSPGGVRSVKPVSVSHPVSHPASGKKIAVVLIRGCIDMTQQLKDTLRILGLLNKNHCVVLDDTAVIRGMIIKVKDYITWGVISDETYQQLFAKRGKEFKARETDTQQKYSYRVLVNDGKKYKPYFALNPPRKGYGRKGIKIAFRAGGALGDRGEKINDLLQRMM